MEEGCFSKEGYFSNEELRDIPAADPFMLKTPKGDYYLYATTVIDANVPEDDGTLYLYFAKGHPENGGKSEICGAVLRDELTGVTGEPVTLLIPEPEWEKRSVKPLWNEVPQKVPAVMCG